MQFDLSAWGAGDADSDPRGRRGVLRMVGRRVRRDWLLRCDDEPGAERNRDLYAAAQFHADGDAGWQWRWPGDEFAVRDQLWRHLLSPVCQRHGRDVDGLGE